MAVPREVIRDVVIEHVEAENARDMERVMRTYAEGAVFDDVPQGRLFRGKDAIAASYQERFDGFPDMRRTIERLTVGDDGAVTEITMRGEQKGVFAGLPPQPGVQVLRICAHFAVGADGLITTETAYYDALTGLTQIGVLPDLQSTLGRAWLLLARPQVLVRRLRAWAGV